MGHNVQNSTSFLSRFNHFFPPKFISRNTIYLIISDSIYKKVQQFDIYYDTVINFYPSATIIDLGQTVAQYSSGAKCQSLIFHACHKSIDKDVSEVASASQLYETITKAIKKMKSH